MSYSSGKRYDLDYVDDKNLFINLIYRDINGEKLAYWTDIIKYLNIKNVTYGRDIEPKYIKEETLKEWIKKYGLNIHHVDAGGQNLFMYAQGQKNSPREGSSSLIFCMDFLQQKTIDFNIVNNSQENLLFNFTSIHSCGYDGNEFFNFLKFLKEKEVKVDFHQKNFEDRNLLFQCLSDNAPQVVIQFYLDKNLNIAQVDKKNYNLLYFLTNYSTNAGTDKFYVKLFNRVFEELENPFQKNNYNDSAIDILVSFCQSNTVHYDRQRGYEKWLKIAFKNIAENKYQKNEKTTESLELFFKENQSVKFKNIELEQAFEVAKISFNARILRGKLSNKENVVSKKIKV